MKKPILTIASAISLSLSVFGQGNGAVLYPSNAPFHKEFGTSVALKPNGAVSAVGSEFGFFDGSVHIYNGTDLKTVLKGSAIGNGGNRFGEEVALSDEFLAVGAYSSGYSGKVYMFKQIDANGTYSNTPTQTIEAGVEYSGFGNTIEIFNDWMAIGNNRNEVYLYKKDGPSNAPWNFKKLITGVEGNSIALSNDFLVLGKTGGSKGTFLVYQKQGNQFNFVYDHTQNVPSWASGSYGIGVAIDNNLILVGDGNGKAQVLSGWGNYWHSISDIAIPGIELSGNTNRKVALKNGVAILIDNFFKGNGEAFVFKQTGGVYVYSHNIVMESRDMERDKVGDIAINNLDKMVISTPHSSFPNTQHKDKGVAFYGSFYQMTSDATTAYEYNDNKWNAKPLTNFQPIKAAIGNSWDVDYYSLQVDKAATYSFSLNDLPANYDIQVLTENEQVLYTGSYTAMHSEYTQLNLGVGKYFVKVYGVNGSSSALPYTLTVGNVSECYRLVDPKIHTPATAGSFEQSGLRNTTDVIDESYVSNWYVFNYYNNEFSTTFLNIYLKNLYVDFDIKLYNENLGLIAYSVKGGSQFEHIRKYLTSGKYYIEVYGYAGAINSNCYSLEFEYEYDVQGARLEGESPIVEMIDKEAAQKSFEVVPNVINADELNSVRLLFSEELTSANIVVRSMTGQNVFDEEVEVNSSEALIQLDQAPAGVYLVIVEGVGVSKLVLR